MMTRSGGLSTAALFLVPAMLVPSVAQAIPPQVALAGISFMIPVIPVLALLLVTVYLAATRNLRLKGFLGRLPGALILVICTVLVYTFFVKLSSTLDGLIDPSAEARLISFITDNAVTRADVDRIDDTIAMVRDAPSDRWSTPVVISAADAADGIRKGRLLVVDVRTAHEYAAGHIVGAARFPRYELEKSAPDWTWMIPADKYLDVLNDLARKNGRRLAFCCSYGVSVSVRTVMELRQRDIDAVMIADGCSAVLDHGIEFHKGPAVADVDRNIAPDVLDIWIRDGLVNTVVAGWPIIIRNGVDIPEGPLVVVSRGDSVEERALRVLTSAIAQSHGKVVVGQSVVGTGGWASDQWRAVMHAGALIEENAGIGSIFVVVFVASLVLFFLATAMVSRRPGRKPPVRWISISVLLLLVIVGAAAILDGTWVANRVAVWSGQHHMAWLLLYVVTTLLVYHRLSHPMGTLPDIALTPAPVDGHVRPVSRYSAGNFLIALFIAAVVFQSSPIVVAFTVAILFIMVIVNASRFMTALYLGHWLKVRAAHLSGKQGKARVVAERFVAALVLNLAGVAFPGIWFLQKAPRGPMGLRTCVRGRPGFMEVWFGDGEPRQIGILSLREADGSALDPRYLGRLRLGLAVAAIIGNDIEVVWHGRDRLPFVRLIFQGPEDSNVDGRFFVPAAIHRQLMSMIADDRRILWAGLMPDDTVLSAERYSELAVQPTPLSFSMLATRSAKHGAAHAVGLLFGYKEYHSRAFRLGARIFEPVRTVATRPGRSRLRTMVASSCVKLSGAVFSDFVLPWAIRFSNAIQVPGKSGSGICSAIDQIVNRFAFCQEMIALSHSIVLMDASDSDRSSMAGSVSFLVDADPVPTGASSWEFMPAELHCAPVTGPTLDLDLARLTSAFGGDGLAALPANVQLLKRAEFFRSAFRRLMHFMISLAGRRLFHAGLAKGYGDLVFFAGRRELNKVLASGASSSPLLVGELSRRKAEWNVIRSLELPVVMTVSDIEALCWDGDGAQVRTSASRLESLPCGVLVSGSLPVQGRARIVGRGAVPASIQPDEIIVVSWPDPSMIPGLTGCAAVLAEAGGTLSHSAMLARELGITMIAGVHGATSAIVDGGWIVIGTDRRVSPGSEDQVVCLGGAAAGASAEFVPLALAGSECGNKAASLAALIRAGFRVPSGFAISAGELSRLVGDAGGIPLRTAVELFAALKPMDMGAGFIVRSSSTVEDGHLSSFAGLFKSVSGVRNAADLAAAINTCSQAVHDSGVRTLYSALGLAGVPEIGLVIQPYVPADFSGVAVSSLPLTDRFDPVLMIESEPGPGGVVGGSANLSAFVLKSPVATPERIAGGPSDPIPDQSVLCDLAATVASIESLLGYPVDIEWCTQGSSVWIVQARPVISRKPS